MENIYLFSDYKTYIKRVLDSAGPRSGLRASAAKAMGVQPAFLSRVLSDLAHLSLEQAMDLNRHFGHDALQGEYFINMVSYSRAGTVDLRSYYKSQMNRIREQTSDLKNRLSQSRSLNTQDKDTYYSNWLFGAVHMALTIPDLQTEENLLRHFGISRTQLTPVLEFLLKTGLAQKSRGSLKVGQTLIHLDRNSPQILRHHTNWRLVSLNKISEQNPSHLHYSVLYSISKSDVERVRENVLEVIQKNLKIVEPSKEETLLAFSTDLYTM